MNTVETLRAALDLLGPNGEGLVFNPENIEEDALGNNSYGHEDACRYCILGATWKVTGRVRYHRVTALLYKAAGLLGYDPIIGIVECSLMTAIRKDGFKGAKAVYEKAIELAIQEQGEQQQ